MDNILYDSLSTYFKVLEAKGYVPDSDVKKMLILGFYNNLVLKDYSQILTEDDYAVIQKALSCLYGSTCLIPFPNYLNKCALTLAPEKVYEWEPVWSYTIEDSGEIL